MSATSDRYQQMDADSRVIAATLLRETRAASLATIDADGPYAAMVAAVATPDFGAVLIHLSDLSVHKRQLLLDPRAALLFCRPDDGSMEILAHERLSLRCEAELVPKASTAFGAAKAIYLAKFPRHELMFGLPDFDLFALRPLSGLLNAGFGRAYAVTPEDLARAASEISGT